MEKYHVAEFNWGVLVDDWDTPAIAEFQDNLDRVNGIADRAAGFVWRMGEEDMEAGQLDSDGPLGGNPRIASTLSVWRSGADLEAFVYRTVHGGFVKKANRWFEPSTGPRYVIWDVAVGHVPTLQEGVDRLKLLAENGPSDQAYHFDWLRNRNSLGQVA